mmetsp:Transcript_9360/g.29838  ORF Transcript_9360/g.29838 Transcript_9360/m.29838 type:complete len:228 (-) Transcript_9360:1373-2056(-)
MESLEKDCALALMVPSKTSLFFSWSSNIFSSMESLVMKRIAVTDLVWPMRWARWTACISTAGFHQGSSKKTCVASCKLRPSPPALSERRMTAIEGSDLKRSRTVLRSTTGMSPMSLTTRRPASRRRHSTMSRQVRYWEKTMALASASAPRIATMASCTASTLVEACHLERSTRWRIESRPSLEPLPTLSTEATRLIGSRHMGHRNWTCGLLRIFSMHSPHATVWPQS